MQEILRVLGRGRPKLWAQFWARRHGDLRPRNRADVSYPRPYLRWRVKLW